MQFVESKRVSFFGSVYEGRKTAETGCQVADNGVSEIASSNLWKPNTDLRFSVPSFSSE